MPRNCTSCSRARAWCANSRRRPGGERGCRRPDGITGYGVPSFVNKGLVCSTFEPNADDVQTGV
ncbi:MAG TPA: hypothetical protein VIK32_05935, partial [Candidatus Limnocylindrales bacterium]